MNDWFCFLTEAHFKLNCRSFYIAFRFGVQKALLKKDLQMKLSKIIQGKSDLLYDCVDNITHLLTCKYGPIGTHTVACVWWPGLCTGLGLRCTPCFFLMHHTLVDTPAHLLQVQQWTQAKKKKKVKLGICVVVSGGECPGGWGLGLDPCDISLMVRCGVTWVGH